MLTLEETKTRPRWVNPDGSIDPSKFDRANYWICVNKAADMSKAALAEKVDTMLSIISIKGTDGVDPMVLERVSIFAYLSSRKK
jgi:hypothetical protein